MHCTSLIQTETAQRVINMYKAIFPDAKYSATVLEIALQNSRIQIKENQLKQN